MKASIIYLPGLNGLRAIAAIAVVLSHITLSLSDFGLNPHILGTSMEGNPKGLLLAGFGVSIFFALSGFLITYLLLLEKEKQAINVQHFYFRRILRIWPLYYLYLALCLLTYFLFDISFDPISLFYYIFFSANFAMIFSGTLPYLVHFWSIGVEEQFYLFYPWLIRKKRNLLQLLGSITLFLILLKLLLWVIDRKTGLSHPLAFLHINRFHCMLLGGLGAVLYYQNNTRFIDFCTNKASQFIAWFIVLLTALNIFHIASVLDNEIISCVTVIIIIGQITQKNRIINLEQPILNFLGKISYGIYVIHPLIIFYSSKLLHGVSVSPVYYYFILYIGITLTTIVVAYISYTYFEKAFLKIKSKFSGVANSPTKILSA